MRPTVLLNPTVISNTKNLLHSMCVNLYYVDPKSEPLLENNMISANEEYNLQEFSNSLK